MTLTDPDYPPQWTQWMPGHAQHRVDFVKTQVHRWIDELFETEDRHDVRTFFAKTLFMRDYLLSPVLNAYETELYLRDEAVLAYMRRFRRLSLDNEVLFERQLSEVLRRGSNGEGLMRIIRDYYAEIYRVLTRTEIFLTGMSGASTVAMVGTGGMPLSLLFMQAFSGARVIGLDINDESLRIGGHFVNFLCESNPSRYRRDAIELNLGDGATFDYGRCDIVILSIHIENKAEIIERIVDTAPRDRAVIIVERQVQGLGQYFYPNYGFNPAGLPLTKVASMCSSLLLSTAYRLEAHV